ncbi:head GIN domain-containing protein [Winogradskyella litorisediminis]|uniref:Head GIN domain-containing protein n=1 Tax=Winogradskyella litorisediminis TaxID=1156618 RepID=A0ABW3NA77_9FLAO
MSTLVKFITATILALLLTSCNLDFSLGPSISGDGNVVTETRDVQSDFVNLKVSRGIDVVLTQSDETSLTVVADQNLHDVITTEFDEDNNTLRISTNENIRTAASKKVILNVKDLYSISTTSGSTIRVENTFETDQLVVSSTSGSQIDIAVETNTLKLNSTSGAGITASGNTNKLSVASTSGSYVAAENLKAESTSAAATSGANIKVNTSKALTASATSGGSVRYSGNPENVSKSDGVSGSIRAN